MKEVGQQQGIGQGTEWLTRAQAAGYLGVSERTIYNFVARKRLKEYSLGRKLYRYKREDLDAMMQEGGHGG